MNNTADLATMGGLRKPRFGGRKPGSLNKRTRQAVEICEAMNFHPAAFLATIAMTGLMPNPDGSTTAVTTDDRIKAATALAPFVMPRLQATQVTGKDEGPVSTATLDINKLLADPIALEAAQALSIRLSMGERDPDQVALPVGDPLSDMGKNSQGHWEK